MNGFELPVPESRWECPNCVVTAVTRRAEPHSEFHHCAGLAGMWAPLVPAGSDCKVEANERDDYIGAETVRLDGNGRPIMSIVTTRADGSNDCAVFAGVAGGVGEALMEGA